MKAYFLLTISLLFVCTHWVISQELRIDSLNVQQYIGFSIPPFKSVQYDLAIHDTSLFIATKDTLFHVSLASKKMLKKKPISIPQKVDWVALAINKDSLLLFQSYSTKKKSSFLSGSMFLIQDFSKINTFLKKPQGFEYYMNVQDLFHPRFIKCWTKDTLVFMQGVSMAIWFDRILLHKEDLYPLGINYDSIKNNPNFFTIHDYVTHTEYILDCATSDYEERVREYHLKSIKLSNNLVIDISSDSLFCRQEPSYLAADGRICILQEHHAKKSESDIMYIYDFSNRNSQGKMVKIIKHKSHYLSDYKSLHIGLGRNFLLFWNYYTDMIYLEYFQNE